MQDPVHTPGRGALDRAMAAHQAGRFAEADRLYREAVAADPGNARALRLRGILAREREDLEGSARLLARAAEVAPGDAAPLCELAVTRLAAGDVEAAERALRAALARDPEHPRTLANLGAILQYRGHVGAAIGAHERALARAPDDAEVLCNLVKALVDAGRAEEALGRCDEALARAPGSPLLLTARALVLNDREDFAAAQACFEQALDQDPDDDMAWVNLAYARVRLGAHDRAIDALEAARRANPHGGRATADLVNLLSGTGRSAEALVLAGDYLAAHPGERHVLAALAYALADAGHEAEARELVDPERHIQVFELPVPAGFSNLGEFNAALCAAVEADASLVPGPSSKSTRGGWQTGELDFTRTPALVAFRGLIDAAVREAVATFSARGLGAHPLMACAVPRASVRAWGTVLEAGGRQAPHIHPLGRFSAAYYARVPADMAAAGPQAGWIEFGAAPERFLLRHRPATRVFEPRPGRLVLFPSYFYHRTLPFGSVERRISLAFDV